MRHDLGPARGPVARPRLPARTRPWRARRPVDPLGPAVGELGDLLLGHWVDDRDDVPVPGACGISSRTACVNVLPFVISARRTAADAEHLLSISTETVNSGAAYPGTCATRRTPSQDESPHVPPRQDDVHLRRQSRYRPGHCEAGRRRRRERRPHGQTAEPHPKLPGTIYTAAAEIESVGGQALPDRRRRPRQRRRRGAVAQAVERFGGIDICVNNASAINLGSVEDVAQKAFDLMNAIQVRGTYAVSRACILHLKNSDNPHILTLSPPIRLESKWLRPTAYMMAKYGMSLCVGYCRGVPASGYRVEHALAAAPWWPPPPSRTCSAVTRRWPGHAKPEVYSMPYAVLNQPAATYTGQSLPCEDVLVDVAGVTDLSSYDCVPGSELGVDLWVDSPNPPGYQQ